MDIFTMVSPTETGGSWEYGPIVNRLISKRWTERYSDHGSFEVVSYDIDKAREDLPLFGYVSHVGSRDVMMIEDHAIEEVRGERPKLTVTGRSLTAIFDRRPLWDWPINPPAYGWGSLTAKPAYAQALELLETNVRATPIENGWYLSPGDHLTGVNFDVTGPTHNQKRYRLDGGYLGENLREILSKDGLGFRLLRHHLEQDLTIYIYKGEDKSDEIVFSYEMDELDRADYFWSVKDYINRAFVRSDDYYIEAWTGVNADTTPLLGTIDATGWNRRWAYQKTGDFNLPPSPTPEQRNQAQEMMESRGEALISENRGVNLISLELSKRILGTDYRIDYDLGDLVTVQGNYGITQIMKVTENTEIEDDTGFYSYPTLGVYEGE